MSFFSKTSYWCHLWNSTSEAVKIQSCGAEVPLIWISSVQFTVIHHEYLFGHLTSVDSGGNEITVYF